jgi:hypothetical protein
LLLFLTGGLGNIAKAFTGSEKIIATLKIFGKEAFSVITLGVVDILALFKSLIGAFVKACNKGLKGFLRWIEALIQEIKAGKKGKSVDDVLEDVEKAIFRKIAYSNGIRGEIQLTLIQKNEIAEYAKLYGIDESQIQFVDELGLRNTSYSPFFGEEQLVINTDVMPGVKNTANSRLSWKAAIAHELEGHRSAALADKTFFDSKLGERANDLLEEIQASTRASYHGKELSNLERKDLLEDALERFNQHKQDLVGTKYEGYSFDKIKEILWTSKN